MAESGVRLIDGFTDARVGIGSKRLQRLGHRLVLAVHPGQAQHAAGPDGRRRVLTGGMDQGRGDLRVVAPVAIGQVGGRHFALSRGLRIVQHVDPLSRGEFAGSMGCIIGYPVCITG